MLYPDRDGVLPEYGGRCGLLADRENRGGWGLSGSGTGWGQVVPIGADFAPFVSGMTDLRRVRDGRGPSAPGLGPIRAVVRGNTFATGLRPVPHASGAHLT